MKYVFLFFIALMPFSSWAQSDPIEKFMDRYNDREGVNHISLQGDLLKLTQSGEDGLMLKIDRLRFLDTDDPALLAPAELRKLGKALDQLTFEELIHWKKDGEQARIWLKEDRQAISDVLLILEKEEGALLLHLQGTFRFEDLNDLDLDIDGSGIFQKLPERRTQVPRA